MAAIHGKESGLWKSPSGLFAKQAGSWVPGKAAWMKINGIWTKIYESVPDNMIVLYDDASHIPADASIVSALVGRFPLGASSYGGTGGAATHAGSAHGESSASSTSNVGGYGQKYDQEGSDHFGSVWSYHYHTYGHTHSDTASNLPSYIDVVPTIGGNIGAGSVWLTTQSSMSALFTAYSAALARYLRLNSVYGTGGSTSHGHTYSGNSSAFVAGPTVSAENCSTGNTVTSANSTHYHSIAHTHTLINDQAYVNLNIYTAVASFSFGELPSGTLAFFTDATLPDGWSRYTIADGRLIKCSNTSIGSIGGSTTHAHASLAFNTGGPAGTLANVGIVGGYGLGTHTHTMNHGHLTAVSWMPPYTGIVIGVKS